VGSKNNFSSTASSTVSLEKPTGAAAGDVLVASITTDLNASIEAGAVPSGWTPMPNVNPLSINSSSTGGARVFAYYKVVSGSDPASYSWTLSAAQKWGGGMTAYRGVNNAQPLDTGVVTAANTSFTGTSLTVPSITTVSNGAQLIGGLGIDSSTTSLISPPSGWTERFEAAGGQVAEQTDAAKTTAGATGPATWTLSSGRAMSGWRTALKPAP
jgi:hypothetical protein